VGFSILLSCCGSPIKRNSVLEGLRARRLADIHDEIDEKADSSSVTDVLKEDGVKERNN
jgi:hypothetical protein